MKKFENIQLLRVLACLGVFITHLAPRLGLEGIAAKAANFGASGVYLFFIISGYLVCLQKEIRPGSSLGELKSFYIKRLFRILPLYYAIIICNIVLHTFILQDVTPDSAGLRWFRYFLLTNAFIPAPDNFWSNLSATWTVSLFAVFYVTAPLWRRLIRGIKSAAAVYLAALCLRYVWAQTEVSAYMMIFYYLHYFLLGMLLWEVKERFEAKKGIFLFAVPAAGIWILLKIYGVEPDYFTTWSWVFGCVILATGRLQIKSSAVRKYMNLIDRFSYSIYLIHAIVLDGIYLVQGKVNLPAAVVLLLTLLLTAAGVGMAEILIERPAKKLSARLVALQRI